MLSKKKNCQKPLYKHFLKLRVNVQDRRKILNFKNKKWERFVDGYKKGLRWYKHKPKDQRRYVMTKYSSRWFSYKNNYKRTLINYKKFAYFYGGIPRKYLKKKIKDANYNTFLIFFESRLDTVLYRAKFTDSMRSAGQLISHKKIYVNNTVIKSKAYQLKQGDIVSVDLKYSFLVRLNIKKAINRSSRSKYVVPPKHLIINYKTLQILFYNPTDYVGLSSNFLFDLNVENLILNYSYH